MALKDWIRRGVTPRSLFCSIGILGIAVVMLCFLFTSGTLWSETFFFNTAEPEKWLYADTGMDFFHSIEYLNGNDPYVLWGTIYPPFANLIFKVFFHMVPDVQKSHWKMDYFGSVFMRGGHYDLRAWMPTMMMFMMFFIAVSLFTCLLIMHYDAPRRSVCLATTTLFGYGFLYAIERGNIIVLSMAAALFFVMYFDSPKRWVRELALLSLAISANIKMYPAVLGLLLLTKHRWKDALRAVVYGLALFVLPCLVYKGGVVVNITSFLQNLHSHTSRVNLNNHGSSFDKVLLSILLLLNRWFGVPIPKDFFYAVAAKLDTLCLLVMIPCGIILPKRWQKVLCFTVGFILFNNQSIYGMSFLTLPAVLFLKEEERFTRANVAPFIGILLGLIWLPVFNHPGDSFSFTSLRLQVALMVLLVYAIAAAVCHLAKGSARRGNLAAAQ